MLDSIKISALTNLPRGGWFVRFESTKDMDGNRVENAIVWSWIDKIGKRDAYFHPETGAYIGEATGMYIPGEIN